VLLDLLLPRRCVLCHTQGTVLCGACATSLPAAPELAPPPGLDSCRSLLRYEGPTRELVAALKFDNHRDAIGLLGAGLAQLVGDELGTRLDAVTWAPTTAARRRERGYDQAELLARAVAAGLRRPCRGLLRRDAGAGQTGRSREQRLDGPRFRARRTPPAQVLLVDDVRTTGATLCAAADVLVEAGATSVHGLTLAVTL
jgi:ComF family protein